MKRLKPQIGEIYKSPLVTAGLPKGKIATLIREMEKALIERDKSKENRDGK